MESNLKVYSIDELNFKQHSFILITSRRCSGKSVLVKHLTKKLLDDYDFDFIILFSDTANFTKDYDISVIFPNVGVLTNNIPVIFPEVDVTNIISYRLINYLNRFNTIRTWCDNNQLIKDNYRDYDFFMIDIICNEYSDKVTKLENYINNVNTTIGNYVTNKDFSTFYRKPIEMSKRGGELSLDYGIIPNLRESIDKSKKSKKKNNLSYVHNY
jgi:energy-coupling factor transporter ATP-binding protein EcfA2